MVQNADILLAGAGVLLCTALLFVAGRRVSSTGQTRRAAILALFAVCATVAALLWAQDKLVWARVFPFTGVVVWGATPLPLVGLLAGVLWNQLSGSKRKRASIVAALLFVAAVHAAKPFLGSPPPTRPQQAKGAVVMQTSEPSCSAASTATVLRYWNLPATETEMARLAFTRADGTAMLGVYRALRLSIQDTPLRVHVLSGADVNDLRRACTRGPVLLSVGLDRFPAKDTDPRYEEEWGWTRGKRHAVVLFGFLPENRLDVGDPSTGREKWSVESLSVLWRGEALYVARPDTLETTK